MKTHPITTRQTATRPMVTRQMAARQNPMFTKMALVPANTLFSKPKRVRRTKKTGKKKAGKKWVNLYK